jgi:hypothetical protein
LVQKGVGCYLDKVSSIRIFQKKPAKIVAILERTFSVDAK